MLREEKIKTVSEENEIQQDKKDLNQFQHNMQKNCLGILLVYSINDKRSFEDLENWIKDINAQKIYDNVYLVLIGNKCDLEKERKIYFEKGEKFALKYNMEFFETSAKDNININESFNALIDEVIYIYKDEFFELKTKEGKIIYKMEINIMVFF